MMYVLILIANLHASDGPVFLMQEFTSYDNCMRAAQAVTKPEYGRGVNVVECVPK